MDEKADLDTHDQLVLLLTTNSCGSELNYYNE
jgi:hypothetical protein